MNHFQKKLAVVKTFQAHGQVYARIIKALCADGHLELTKTDHHRLSTVPWNSDRAIQTYDDCVELQVHSDKKGLEWLKLYIWNGENLRGHRTELRTTYWFKGEWWRNVSLQKALDVEFKYHCERELEREAKKEHDLRVELMGKKLLDRITDVPLLPAPEETEKVS